MYRLTKIGLIAFVLIVALAMVAPVAACDYTCGPHDDGTCAPGQICQSSNCHDTYGSCNNCPYVNAVYGSWGTWENGKCLQGESSDTCADEHVSGQTWHHHHRTYTPGYYNCHTSGYVSCDGSNHEKQITGRECDYSCVPNAPFTCEQGQYQNHGACVSSCQAWAHEGQNCEATCEVCAPSCTAPSISGQPISVQGRLLHPCHSRSRQVEHPL